MIIWRNLPANGMAIFPFIILKDKVQITDAVLINHEKIHLRQQLELLLIFFYFFYLLNYLVNLLRYKDHDKAYRSIIFEKEAYSFDHDLDYLNKRRFLGFLRLL